MVAAAAATSILSLCGSPAVADTQANASATDSPGVLAGNNVQVPVEVPVNACGNSADGVAALNPTFGNSCANDEDSHRSGSHGAPHAESGPRHGSGHGHDGHGPRHGSVSGSSHDSGRGSGQGRATVTTPVATSPTARAETPAPATAMTPGTATARVMTATSVTGTAGA